MQISVVNFHLFGTVAYSRCVRLQRRLMYEAAASDALQAVVLLCEHSPIITIGRHGSRSHISLSDEQLHREGLEIRWVHRDGGCILHVPGQLGIYAVLPLERFGWEAAEVRQRFSQGLQAALTALSFKTVDSRLGLRGSTGLLAVDAMSVDDGVTHHGSFLNVSPAMSVFRSIEVAKNSRPEALGTGQRETMSCLLAERRQPVRMSQVRSSMITALTAAFCCERHHIHTGHPWLPVQGNESDAIAWAS